jgi:hypothetical protein
MKNGHGGVKMRLYSLSFAATDASVFFLSSTAVSASLPAMSAGDFASLYQVSGGGHIFSVLTREFVVAISLSTNRFRI